MAKITVARSARKFTLEVNEQELYFIERALLNDKTNDNENGTLYHEVIGFMRDNDVEES